MERFENGFTFSFFEEWCLELKKSGEFNSGIESKLLFSWQVALYLNVVHVTFI